MKDDDNKVGRPEGTKNPYYMPSEQVRVPTELVGVVKSLVKTYREQRKIWLNVGKTKKDNGMKIIYNTDNLANTTQCSLECLNDVLSRFHDGIKCVVQVNVQNDLCGFAIILIEEPHIHYDPLSIDYSMYFTGKGFRRDKGGEGGRGYLEALKLLEEFSIQEITIDYPLLKRLDANEEMCLIVKSVEKYWLDYK